MVHAWQARQVPTSAKDKTGNADAVDATPDDVETFGDEVREHICPGQPSSNFDGPLFLVEDDIPEAGH
jgi:hypothetical protein